MLKTMSRGGNDERNTKKMGGNDEQRWEWREKHKKMLGMMSRGGNGERISGGTSQNP